MSERDHSRLVDLRTAQLVPETNLDLKKNVQIDLMDQFKRLIYKSDINNLQCCWSKQTSQVHVRQHETHRGLTTNALSAMDCVRGLKGSQPEHAVYPNMVDYNTCSVSNTNPLRKENFAMGPQSPIQTLIFFFFLNKSPPITDFCYCSTVEALFQE